MKPNHPLHGQRRWWLAVASILLIFIALLGWRAWRQLAISPAPPLGFPNGPIAFMSNRSGNWDIHCLDKDGNLRNLTSNDTHELFPASSFDGRALLYISTAEDSKLATILDLETGERTAFGAQDIVKIALATFAKERIDWAARWFQDADATIARIGMSLRNPLAQLEIFAYESGQEESATTVESTQQISDGAPGVEWMPAVSPDGTLIAFISDRDGDNGLYLIPRSGGEIQPLAQHPAADFAPFWSLDGEWLAFFSERAEGLASGNLRLYLIRPDGRDLHELAAGESFAGGAALSPDGKTRVYASNESGHWHLYEMKEGENTGRALTAGEHDNLYPSWFPQTILCQEGGE